MTPLLVAAYLAVSLLLLFAVGRRDFFFGVFFALMVLYSVVTPVGYLLFPEISEHVLRMYFGPEALAPAMAFALASMLALYAGFRWLYLPLTREVAVEVRSRPRVPVAYLGLLLAFLGGLLAGLLHYGDRLSYANASDVDFIAAEGWAYRVFWQLFKWGAFVLLVMHVVRRRRVLEAPWQRFLHALLFVAVLAAFVAIAVATGNRTDPLALVLGLVACEFHLRSLAGGIGEGGRRAGLGRFALAAGLALLATAWLLVRLEAARGSAFADDMLDTPMFIQSLLVKDYHVPFHVLIGAMHHGYVDPLAVLASNGANALMFLGVDFLQAFDVANWDPGSVTRAASPAMHAFTEGYIFMGPAGFLYNGLVWAGGLALWRLLSRTRDEGFNAAAFALTVAMAATVARSQSSYFVKDVWFLFLPALFLYGLASGRYPMFLSTLASRLVFPVGRNPRAEGG